MGSVSHDMPSPRVPYYSELGTQCLGSHVAFLGSRLGKSKIVMTPTSMGMGDAPFSPRSPPPEFLPLEKAP
jgi:hypothetical protein